MVTRLPKGKGRRSKSELADIAGFKLQTDAVQTGPPLPDLPFLSELAEARTLVKVPDDHKVLTQLITLITPRHPAPDMWATSLLNQFGSLAALLSAPDQVMQGIVGQTPAFRVTLRLVQEAAVRLHKARLKRVGVLADRAQLKAYLSAMLAHERVEQVRVLFLDKGHRLLADEMLGRGTVDHTPIYPREVMRRALELQASILVVVHNHPSGDPSPSQDDIFMTQRIAQAATLLGITVWDHVIVGSGCLLSLKEEGVF
ncbi:DNA repair protein RadC [Acetobacter cerevisiae]|uniref:DNA repair protein RadC n=1 Tax=Acetobacter cerevisiae TaxID=178900 RepID=A0ABT1EM64_9PROT|nr:DNA repair protein RadC [Acetobacter cerevisiae]MCP1244474.1 DNA repair protein RadC [Acetobacter cerevisiae]MCP1254051.1 DNA repair protein RadC [Acetobacter cerevisiae]